MMSPRLLDSLLHRRDRVLWCKVVALQHSLARGDRAGEDLGVRARIGERRLSRAHCRAFSTKSLQARPAGRQTLKQQFHRHLKPEMTRVCAPDPA